MLQYQLTAAKLVNKLQFRNMKVSAFVFRKEAKKKKKTQVAPYYGELYVGCCMLQSQQEDSTTTWQQTGKLHRAPILSRGSTCLTAHQSWWSIIYDVV